MSVNPNIERSTAQRSIPVDSTDRESSLDHIRTSAQKVTTLVMDKDKMHDYWGGNAKLPGVLQVFAAPYRLISYVHNSLEKRIAPALEVKNYKLMSDIAKIAEVVIKALLYACKIGITAAFTIGVMAPLLLTVGLFIVILEAGVEGYQLYQQNKFLNQFGAKTFAVIDLLKGKLGELTNNSDRVGLLAVLEKTINTDKGISPGIKEEILASIQRLDPEDPSFEEKISELLHNTEKKLLQDRLQQLENKYFKLTEKDVDSVVDKTKHHFDEQEFDARTTRSGQASAAELGASHPDIESSRSESSAADQRDVSYDIEHGMGLIQKAFEKKQLQLAGKVQPWLAQKIASSYKELLTALQTEEEVPGGHMRPMEEAKELLTRIDFNAQLKADVHKTNLKIWVLTLCSYVISFIFPQLLILPVIFFIGATIGTVANNVMISTRLNNEESMDKRAWANLLPECVRKIFTQAPTQPSVDLRTRRISHL